MGLFLISQIPWGSNAFEFDTLRCPRPLQICFRGYPMPQLLQVHAHRSVNGRCMTDRLLNGRCWPLSAQGLRQDMKK